jgi:hypothetical protein
MMRRACSVIGMVKSSLEREAEPEAGWLFCQKGPASLLLKETHNLTAAVAVPPAPEGTGTF